MSGGKCMLHTVRSISQVEMVKYEKRKTQNREFYVSKLSRTSIHGIIPRSFIVCQVLKMLYRSGNNLIQNGTGTSWIQFL